MNQLKYIFFYLMKWVVSFNSVGMISKVFQTLPHVFSHIQTGNHWTTLLDLIADSCGFCVVCVNHVILGSVVFHVSSIFQLFQLFFVHW